MAKSAFYSQETQGRAKKHLNDILSELGMEGEVHRRTLHDGFFLQVGSEKKMYVARTFERMAKTGPYVKEPSGQVSIVVGRDETKKTFTESKATKRFTPKKWAQIVEWAKTYAETEIEKKRKEAKRWHDQRAVDNRLDEVFGDYADSIPGAKTARFSSSNWDGNEICAQITIIIPADAIEPVAEALRTALAPFAETEE